MRIAITGTHGSGKTTLIEDFVDQHLTYEATQEPYWDLAEQGIALSDEPSIASFTEQLSHSLKTILTSGAEQNIIFDRCPLDFMAYLEVLSEQDGDEWEPSGQLLRQIEQAFSTLDLIIFLPLISPDEITTTIEYPKLRKQTDTRLKQILRDDTLGLLDVLPETVELRGSKYDRVKALSKLVSEV
ncbi:AAA family ATPase [Pseudovibrio sp. Alg231-02]|uniref:AAA family ATPase n=1 Tax=Pseudovibrio sp. Alg231-02 TaxID=1922223 RepID=UPI000D561940|nr:AAA family ATPase [Pseudovibrio sp. Alg231-02]